MTVDVQLPADRDFEKTFTVELGWNRGLLQERLQSFYDTQPEHDKSMPFRLVGSRMKAICSSIIRNVGWGVYMCAELAGTMQELRQAGDSNVAAFFIELSYKVIPGRRYSTLKLSTPEIRDARCSLLTGSTPATVHELIEANGAKGVLRRVMVPAAVRRGRRVRRDG